MPSVEARNPTDALRHGPPWWLHGLLLLAAALLFGLALAFSHSISDEYRAPSGRSSAPSNVSAGSPS